MTLFAAGSCLIAACVSAPATLQPPSDRDSSVTNTQIMVLGTYHFAGSDGDLISIETDSVLTPHRQAELATLSDALAAFDPTHIVVERVTDGPDYIDPVYQKFHPDMLTQSQDERVQLGYRLAHQLGHETVYGIDEQATEDEPPYFPFGKLKRHAEATGQADDLDAMVAEAADAFAQINAASAGQSIAVKLLDQNTDPALRLNAAFYFDLAKYDVAEDQPAAELQAYWFMRNAKIFSKIVDVTAPGDRVLVVYGVGHKYWLDTMARDTSGYVSVDPVPYLEQAAKLSGTTDD